MRPEMRQRLPGRGPALSALAFAATLILVLAIPPAEAGVSSSCSPGTDSAELFIDEPGAPVNASVGYKQASFSIGYRYKETDPSTPATAGSGSCGNDSDWQNLGVELGDRDDSIRLDAGKPKPIQDEPLPAVVDVIIDGGQGDDTLRGHSGSDEFYGRRGDDTIRIAGGGDDFADCGPGHDKVIRSGIDLTSSDCEKVVG